MKNKVCTKCGIEKSTNEFYKNRATKDGLQCHCKKCSKISAKNPQRKNPEKRELKLNKKIDKILENNEKCCVNCHHCIPYGIENKWKHIVKCDVTDRLYGFKETRSIFFLMKKYKNGKYPFACRCFHYYGGP